MGLDVSDERLGRLRQLPNLKRIELLFAQKVDVFLDRLKGMPTIETLDLEFSHPWDERLTPLLRSFPRLRRMTIRAPGACADEYQKILQAALPKCKCDVHSGY